MDLNLVNVFDFSLNVIDDAWVLNFRCLNTILKTIPGFLYEKERHTLGIVCKSACLVVAFDKYESLIEWEQVS